MLEDRHGDMRGEPRAGVDAVLEIYDVEGRVLLGIARLQDLSVSGACVSSTSRLGEHSRATIRLLLSKNRLLTLSVEVMWERPLGHVFEYGLKFGDYPEMEKSLILQHVLEYFSHSSRLDFDVVPPKGGTFPFGGATDHAEGGKDK